MLAAAGDLTLTIQIAIQNWDQKALDTSSQKLFLHVCLYLSCLTISSLEKF